MIQMRSIFNVNKRGEEQASGTGYLLAGAIAVAVLAIVGYFVYSFYTGKAIPSFGFLPSFNETKAPVIDLEIFRYLVIDDKLQYYDGTSWVDFKEGTTIEANGKKIEYLELYIDLSEKFFLSVNSANVVKAAFAGKAAPEISVDFEMATEVKYKFNRDSAIWKYNGVLGWGNVKDMPLAYAENNVVVANELKYKDEAKGYLYLMKLTKDSDIETISGIPYDWFDSSLSDSVTINYLNQTNAKKSIVTCFQKDYYFRDRALVVDLSKPLATGGTCSST